MRKIQEFMKNRCGIDELNFLFLCLSLASYFVYIFLSTEKKIWICIFCVICILLCVYRMFSKNLEWRKKENDVFLRFCSFFEAERNVPKKKNRKIAKKGKRAQQQLKNMAEEPQEVVKEAEEKKDAVLEEDKRKRESDDQKEKDVKLRETEQKKKEEEEQRRKEEEKRAAEALLREQKKREQRQREQRFDPNYVYFNCPYCNQAIRIPKRQGKVKITCPTCKNKFIKET